MGHLEKLVAVYCRAFKGGMFVYESPQDKAQRILQEVTSKGGTLYRLYDEQETGEGFAEGHPQLELLLRDAGLDRVDDSSLPQAGQPGGSQRYVLSGRQPLFDEIWLMNGNRFSANPLSDGTVGLLGQNGVAVLHVGRSLAALSPFFQGDRTASAVSLDPGGTRSAPRHREVVFAERFKTETGQRRPARRRWKLVLLALSLAALAGAAVYLTLVVVLPGSHYREAQALLASGDYEQAAAMFASAGQYGDAPDQVLAVRYAEAEALMEEERYAEAAEAFARADGFRDAADRMMAAHYARGEALLAKDDYDEAIAAFREAGAWMDAAGKVSEAYYAKGETLLGMDEYRKAISAYQGSKGHQDSSEKIALCRKELLRNPKPGDIVLFGQYEQDNKPANGSEDIAWLVLGVQDRRVRLLSQKNLDCRRYNETYALVTWETCTLREWLNGPFFSDAFDQDERNAILLTTAGVTTNPGYGTKDGVETQDHVFLLSAEEAAASFAEDKKRVSANTASARAMGAGTDKAGSGWWWLRTPGAYTSNAMYVYSDGKIFEYGYIVNYPFGGVRPAITIDLDAL